MAIGYPASYSRQIDLTVDREIARDVIRYSFQLLGWHFENADRNTFLAKVPMSGSSWGERVEVSLAEPGSVFVRSYGVFPMQVVDWGKNKRNVERICEIFDAKVQTEAKVSHEPPRYLDSKGKTPVERVFDDGTS